MKDFIERGNNIFLSISSSLSLSFLGEMNMDFARLSHCAMLSNSPLVQSLNRIHDARLLYKAAH